MLWRNFGLAGVGMKGSEVDAGLEALPPRNGDHATIKGSVQNNLQPYYNLQRHLQGMSILQSCIVTVVGTERCESTGKGREKRTKLERTRKIGTSERGQFVLLKVERAWGWIE